MPSLSWMAMDSLRMKLWYDMRQTLNVNIDVLTIQMVREIKDKLTELLTNYDEVIKRLSRPIPD